MKSTLLYAGVVFTICAALSVAFAEQYLGVSVITALWLSLCVAGLLVICERLRDTILNGFVADQPSIQQMIHQMSIDEFVDLMIMSNSKNVSKAKLDPKNYQKFLKYIVDFADGNFSESAINETLRTKLGL